MRNDINTIYIISKGRPNCITAQTLTDLKYPGEWFIVCGNNDDKLPEYQERWGDRVLVFDWYKQIEKTDPLDNFGFEDKPSGAIPVRNAVCDISNARGERRHWQFDDDISNFSIKHPTTVSNMRLNGELLEKYLYNLALFADRTGIYNCGINAINKTYPDRMFIANFNVYVIHNMPSNPENFVEWRGRVADDHINVFDCYRQHKLELSVFFIGFDMFSHKEENGGMVDLYKDNEIIRKVGYMILINPFCKLDYRKGEFKTRLSYKNLVPKILPDKYRKYKTDNKDT